jgi:hypothetical protein
LWGKKEHMMGGMDHMMSEKMMEMMSKEDMMMISAMKMEEKIAMLELKLDYMKKMRDMLNKKM